METESKILIAIISASSAIAGAVISQIVTVIRDWIDKKHQRNVLLRNKYEELANLVTNSQEWIGEQFTANSLKELRNSPPIHARKAMILSHIYFPLLRTDCENYMNSCVKLQTMLIDNHEFKFGIDCGTQAVHKNSKAVELVSSQLRDSRQTLDNSIINYAKKYAKV